jgi:hypothetical protein
MPAAKRPRSMVVLSVVAGTSLLVLGGPAAGVLAASHSSRAPHRAAARCPSVPGTKVRKQTAQIKVFSQPFHTVTSGGGQQVGKRYLGCALPRGKVFTLDRSYQEYIDPGSVKGQTPVDSGGVYLHQSAGTFLQVEDQQANLMGDYHEVRLQVFNLATGHHYSYGHLLEEPVPSRKYPPLPLRALLNNRGQLAGVYVNPTDSTPTDFSDPAPGSTEIVTFGAGGTRTIIDSAPSAQIPPGSLNLNGSTVSWTHAGQAKTATIG